MTTNIWIQEQWINVTENYSCGETDVYETHFDLTQKGKLFESLKKQYGRCVSKVFIGKEKPIHVGWVFQKRAPYEDSREKFLQETWITLHKDKPEKTITYNYLESGRVL